MRGIYLATHFNNYYEAAALEELERYVEDLSLWGFNLLALSYPHWLKSFGIHPCGQDESSVDVYRCGAVSSVVEHSLDTDA